MALKKSTLKLATRVTVWPRLLKNTRGRGIVSKGKTIGESMLKIMGKQVDTLSLADEIQWDGNCRSKVTQGD